MPAVSRRYSPCTGVSWSLSQYQKWIPFVCFSNLDACPSKEEGSKGRPLHGYLLSCTDLLFWPQCVTLAGRRLLHQSWTHFLRRIDRRIPHTTQVHSQLPSITIDIIRWQITGRGRLTNKAKLQKVFLGVHWTKGPVKRAPSWCQLFAQLSPLWSPPPPPALTCSAQSTSTASSVTLIHILPRFWEPSEPLATNWQSLWDFVLWIFG